MEVAAPAIENISTSMSKVTIPGIGPYSLTEIEEIVPSLENPNLRDAAIVARRLQALEDSLEDPASAFWQNWMDLSRNWRITELTQEQNQQVMMWISRWTDTLFPR
jgi:hypothetical protein